MKNRGSKSRDDKHTSTDSKKSREPKSKMMTQKDFSKTDKDREGKGEDEHESSK